MVGGSRNSREGRRWLWGPERCQKPCAEEAPAGECCRLHSCPSRAGSLLGCWGLVLGPGSLSAQPPWRFRESILFLRESHPFHHCQSVPYRGGWLVRLSHPFLKCWDSPDVGRRSYYTYCRWSAQHRDEGRIVHSAFWELLPNCPPKRLYWLIFLPRE